MAPFDQSNPAEGALSIVRELERFSPALARRERWLVLNKTDLLDADELQERRAAVIEALDWQGPVYEVAAINGSGTDTLCGEIMVQLETWKALELEDAGAAEDEQSRQRELQAEARERIQKLRLQRSQTADVDVGDDDFDDDDDDDGEIEYAP
jgi:GTP-binding protein